MTGDPGVAGTQPAGPVPQVPAVRQVPPAPPAVRPGLLARWPWLAWPLTLWLWLLLLVLGLMSLAGNLGALLLLPIVPRSPGHTAVRALGLRVGHAIGRTGIAYGYRLFWVLARASGLLRLEAEVLDALRDEPRLIVVANHPSMLDAVMLVARLPRSICIMKASLLRNVFLGAGARLAGYISNASAMGMLRHAVADLQRGGQLVLFPEGTRTTQWPLDPFQASAPLIAKLAQAPIQTVFIDTDSPYLGKGWPLWRLPPLPIVFRVRLGRRFAPPTDVHTLRNELEAYYHAEIAGASEGGPAQAEPSATATAAATAASAAAAAGGTA